MKRKAQFREVQVFKKQKSAPSSQVVVVPQQQQRAFLKSKVTGEMKYFDCDFNSTAITAVTTTWVAGTIVDPLTTINLGSAAVAAPLCLFVPIIGAQLNNRIGRQVNLMKIKITGTITVPVQAGQNTADNPGLIRLMCVWDKQTNAAQMTSAQLMQDATAAATTISSYMNPNNFGRFQVLKEKRFVVGDQNMAGEVAAGNVIIAGTKKYFKITYNFRKPVVVHFNATNAGTVADIVDNSFHVICGCDNIATGPQLAYYSRCSFKE